MAHYFFLPMEAIKVCPVVFWVFRLHISELICLVNLVLINIFVHCHFIMFLASFKSCFACADFALLYIFRAL